MEELATWQKIWLVIGALWWALRLGYDEDKTIPILLCWVIILLWPLDIAYGFGRSLRK